MRWWLPAFEAWAVTRLLASPTFHRAVRSVHKTVQRARHGTPPEEMGGTNIDKPQNVSMLLQHFRNELKEQMGFKDKKR